MKTKTSIGIAIGVVAIGLVAWSRWKSEKTTEVPEAAPQSITTLVVKPAEIVQTLAVSGTLVGENEATVISETNGKIVAIKARVGDWLNKDQTIVQVENELQEVALEQAKAQLLAAQTNFDKAQKDLARYDDLFKQQIATQHDMESARLGARAAEAQLKSAEAALKLAQRQFDDTAIEAPLAGRLADRYVDVAAMVSPGDRIGVVVDTRNMKLKTSVSENDVLRLHTGQPVRIEADAVPGVIFSGKIFSVAQKANGERVYPVEILVANDQAESLKSGMFGRATIEVAKAENAIVLPSTAVLSDDANSHYVYTEQNGVVKRVEVVLGLQQTGNVQIVSGLQIGAYVVVSGQQSLSDGASVSVQN